MSIFEGMGVTVAEDAIDLHDAEDTFQTLRAAQFVGSYASLLENHRDQLKPEVIWNIEKGLQLKAGEIAQGDLARGAISHRAAEFFQRYDLLVCPTAAVPPFDVDKRYVTEINGIELANYIEWLMITSAITLTACPSISIPCGFTKSGLLVGLQIVGPRAMEHSVLSAAAMFEQEAGLVSQLPVDPRDQPAGY